jgi:hypothetical protein
VDAESRGENARTAYPAVYKHLKTCEECRISYDLLTSRAQDEDRGALPPVSEVALPFLAQAAPDAAWSKRVRSPIGGAPLGFGFTISPGHLARTIAQAPQFAVRGETTTERSLLLLDSIALGRRDVQVELWLHFSDNPDYARLEISVVSSSPLPEPLRVNLSWNDHHYASAIDQGQGWIDQIPLSDLENANVSVEFEAGQPAPSVEG